MRRQRALVGTRGVVTVGIEAWSRVRVMVRVGVRLGLRLGVGPEIR